MMLASVVLPSPGGPYSKHVVHGLAARLGGLDGDRKILLDLLLADEFRKPLGTQFQFKRRIVLDRRSRY